MHKPRTCAIGSASVHEGGERWARIGTPLGISYDSVDVLKGFADKQKISFPLLSDPESKTILAYARQAEGAVSSWFKRRFV